MNHVFFSQFYASCLNQVACALLESLECEKCGSAVLNSGFYLAVEEICQTAVAFICFMQQSVAACSATAAAPNMARREQGWMFKVGFFLLLKANEEISPAHLAKM